jgi:glutamate dehydrogenase/leucine dehydrogenase
VTGKPVDLGGSVGRTQATGRGCVIVLMEAARDLGIDPAGATAVIQGWGNAAQHAALELARHGSKVIGVSDSQAAIVNRDGLEVPALIEHKRKTGSVRQFPNSQAVDHPALLCQPCDFLIPAALEDSVTKENAPQINARLISEAANGPTTSEAADILYQRGIRVVPDVLASGGGVLVSYFEWVQNRQEYYWTDDEVADRMAQRMVAAYRQVAERANDHDVSLRQAAYEIAIDRVVHAALQRGVQ